MKFETNLITQCHSTKFKKVWEQWGPAHLLEPTFRFGQRAIGALRAPPGSQKAMTLAGGRGWGMGSGRTKHKTHTGVPEARRFECVVLTLIMSFTAFGVVDHPKREREREGGGGGDTVALRSHSLE